MKKWMLLLGFLSACSNLQSPQFKSLIAAQPRVEQISPADGTRLTDPIRIELQFSHGLDGQSVQESTVVLIQGKAEESLLQDAGDFMEEMASDEIETLPVTLSLSEDGFRVQLQPKLELSPGIYQVIVTPGLHSVGQIPFNQKPGDKPSLFVATFSYGEGFDATIEGPQETGGESPQGPSFGPKPESLVINELLYDGLTSETDGEAFVELYGTPGADISLYKVSWLNGADGAETDRVTLPAASLIGETGIFVIADLNTNSTTASKVLGSNFLDQFDPQNGPDAVQLFDRDGKLLDSVTYGPGAVENSSDGHPLTEGDPAKDVAGGHSLSRVAGVDTNDNAKDFTDLSTPTPGEL